MEKVYPDIAPLLQAKAERRRALAALSWEEKVAIIEQMRQLLPKDAWRDKPIEHNESLPSAQHDQEKP